MKIIDVNGIVIAEEGYEGEWIPADGRELPDLSKGVLREDKLFVRHHDSEPAVEGREGEWHYEVTAEYPETGGMDVKKVWDIEPIYGRPASDAWDEYESVLRYIPDGTKLKSAPTIDELVQRLETLELRALS